MGKDLYGQWYVQDDQGNFTPLHLLREIQADGSLQEINQHLTFGDIDLNDEQTAEKVMSQLDLNKMIRSSEIFRMFGLEKASSIPVPQLELTEVPDSLKKNHPHSGMRATTRKALKNYPYQDPAWQTKRHFLFDGMYPASVYLEYITRTLLPELDRLYPDQNTELYYVYDIEE